ncbi:MAG: ferritin-like domain-containing protein [Thermoanaerobaculia bacterium]
MTLLNFYRASELHGGLILGQMARRANDPDLIAKLTRHSAEGTMHALWWTETIARLDGHTSPVGRTYQTRLAEKAGTPISFLEVMAMSSAFEHRIYRYFTLHLRQASVHPVVAATLRRMLVDERWHLTWLREWLRDEAMLNAAKVSAAVSRYSAADQLICEELSIAYGFRKAA